VAAVRGWQLVWRHGDTLVPRRRAPVTESSQVGAAYPGTSDNLEVRMGGALELAMPTGQTSFRWSR
jgi:hypothetical protein